MQARQRSVVSTELQQKQNATGKQMLHKKSEKDILDYLDAHGTIDKDAVFIPRKKNRPGKFSKERKNPRCTIDLHGLTSDTAVIRVRSEVTRCRENGIRELIIIHGVGYHSNRAEGPVLRKVVRDMLDYELTTMVRDYRTASPKDGGDGATVVYLK